MLEDFPEYIIDHRIDEEGHNIYYVKWLGCDITDNTWETEDKLRKEWPSTLLAYRKKSKSGKVPTITHSSTRVDDIYAYTESLQDWESAVDEIAYIEKSKIPGFVVYINWKNGYKSIHHSTEVYAKCPQKMIEYFEKFAKFNEIFFDE